MSLISSKLSLTHRATIQRDANVGLTDEWNNPLPPDWQDHLVDLPCRAWVVDTERVTNQSTFAVILEVHMIVPLGTDITESDRVAQVTYRGGTAQDGPLTALAVLRRRDHLELLLSKAV